MNHRSTTIYFHIIVGCDYIYLLFFSCSLSLVRISSTLLLLVSLIQLANCAILSITNSLINIVLLSLSSPLMTSSAPIKFPYLNVSGQNLIYSSRKSIRDVNFRQNGDISSSGTPITFKIFCIISLECYISLPTGPHNSFAMESPP